MTLWEALFQSLRKMGREPRFAARDLLALSLPKGALGIGFLIVMLLSVIATEPLLRLAGQMFPGDPLPPILRAIGSVLGGLAVAWVIWNWAVFWAAQGGLIRSC